MKNFYFIVAIFDVILGSYMLLIGKNSGWFLIGAALCLGVCIALKVPDKLDKDEEV